MALTFDDGPDPRYTPRVLSLLRARGARATFFMIGRNVEQYPELARRVVAEGHAIGNHTWNHEVMVGHTGSWNLDEIRRCDEEIRAACGRRSRLLRPPKGRSDERTLQAARATGHRVILWTVAVENHSARTPEEMAERVLSRVEPGAIILCHDGEPGHPISRERTMRALPLVVDGLQRRGYGFVTVPELLALGEARAR